MNSSQTQQVQQLLSQPRNVVIVGHKNPDGDAIGSCLGLAGFLGMEGHHCQVIMPNDFPEFLKWMPGADSILCFDKNAAAVRESLAQADLVFTLDFNALNRTGELGAELEAFKGDFVMIDHHQQPDDYAVVTYSDVSMSSTAQMVYHFMEALDGASKIDADMATNLYTGIMTDTGSFRFPATTATTHRVIAALIDAGANNSFIHGKVFDSNSASRLKLLGVALNNMVLMPEYRTAYITLTQKELDEHHFRKGDTEGFVNYGLSIEGMVMAVIFIENAQEGITKISFRSKGDFSVNELARTHFHGGGHTNAAGGRSELPIGQTVDKFISILPAYKHALLHDS